MVAKQPVLSPSQTATAAAAGAFKKYYRLGGEDYMLFKLRPNNGSSSGEQL